MLIELRVFNTGAPIFETKSFESPALIVYASTGITVSTTAVVNDVAAKKAADEKWFEELMARYMEICAAAPDALRFMLLL